MDYLRQAEGAAMGGRHQAAAVVRPLFAPRADRMLWGDIRQSMQIR
jgi:hypothetical protein